MADSLMYSSIPRQNRSRKPMRGMVQLNFLDMLLLSSVLGKGYVVHVGKRDKQKQENLLESVRRLSENVNLSVGEYELQPELDPTMMWDHCRREMAQAQS